MVRKASLKKVNESEPEAVSTAVEATTTTETTSTATAPVSATAPSSTTVPVSATAPSFESLVADQAKLFSELDGLVKTLRQNQRKVEQSFARKLKEATAQPKPPKQPAVKKQTPPTENDSAEAETPAPAVKQPRKVAAKTKKTATTPPAAAEVTVEA